MTVTDVAGRTVTFDKLPERIILGEGRALFATSIIDREQPLNKVVAMGNDIKTAAPSYYEKLLEAHPEAKDVQTIGSVAKGDVSVETLLALDPDVITITMDHYKAAKDTGILDKIDSAGLKYVVTDFRIHPLENTTKSVEVYGQILGNPERAKEFTNDWNTTVQDVRTKTQDAAKPEVFAWRAGGYADCCASVKNANIGEFVKVAGGTNLGDTLLDAEMGSLTPEKLIEQQPEKILVTGGSWAPKNDNKITHVPLGYTAQSENAEKGLADLSKIPGMDKVNALNNGNSLAIWHQFYDSPLNYIAIQAIAKWLHPEAFKEVDIERQWKAAHEKYVPFAATGTFFVEGAH
ncbi:ABC transporter substrate-binding protein [Corynebacterium sp. H130]|uniref:ABC transporter substrate-binding protein n=1 Tax=Corynebacterium sp. H130 TaxID=3133444 RepID=UPI0030B6C0C8